MLAPPVDDGGNRPAVEIVEPPADQGETLRGEIDHRRREIELAVEPRLDRVLVGGLHVGEVLALQRAHVCGHNVAEHAILLVAANDADHHARRHRGRERSPHHKAFEHRTAIGGALRRHGQRLLDAPTQAQGRVEAQSCRRNRLLHAAMDAKLPRAPRTRLQMPLDVAGMPGIELAVEQGVEQDLGFCTSHVRDPSSAIQALRNMQRAREPRHDRSNRYADDVGNLPIGELVDLAQHDGFAERHGQVRNEPADGLRIPFADHRGFRRGWSLLPERRGLLIRLCVLLRRNGGAGAARELRTTDVAENGEQPRLHRRAVIAVEMPQRAHIAFLRGILGIGAVAKEVPRERVDVVQIRERGVAETARRVLMITAAVSRDGPAFAVHARRRRHQLRPGEHHCAALLPVVASTTTVPVMYGCSEQKYWYTPGVVNVNEKLSSVSSAFDLNSLLEEATVCGVSSALSQATVVPAFTVTRAGEKAKLSISTLLSGACAEITGKLIAAATRMPAANGTARRLMSLIFVRMIRPLFCVSVRCDQGRDTLGLLPLPVLTGRGFG